MIYRKHYSVPINHVNPIYVNNLEPIHMVVGSLLWPMPTRLGEAGASLRRSQDGWQLAIPTNHDRLLNVGGSLARGK
jgi:hypothetical protein